jgi:hypothetical protein
VPGVQFSNNEERHEEEAFSHVVLLVQEGLVMPPCKIVRMHVGSECTGHDMDGKLLLVI